MLPRNRYAIGLLVAVIVLTAGCNGLLGEGPLEYAASEVTVSDSAVQETDFERTQERSFHINRTVDVANETRDVRIESHLSAYQKEYEGVALGHFVALSTPKAEKFGQALNPLGIVDEKTLVQRAMDRIRGSNAVSVTGVSKVGTEQATILGSQTEVAKFDATAERSGTSRDVFVYATRVEHGDDFVIAVGVYPKGNDGGGDEIATLMAGIEHSTDDS